MSAAIPPGTKWAEALTVIQVHRSSPDPTSLLELTYHNRALPQASPHGAVSAESLTDQSEDQRIAVSNP